MTSYFWLRSVPTIERDNDAKYGDRHACHKSLHSGHHCMVGITALIVTGTSVERLRGRARKDPLLDTQSRIPRSIIDLQPTDHNLHVPPSKSVRHCGPTPPKYAGEEDLVSVHVFCCMSDEAYCTATSVFLTNSAVCWFKADRTSMHRVMVRCMYSGLAGGLPFVALLACVGGLKFIAHVCLWWFPALVPAFLCTPKHRVSL